MLLVGENLNLYLIQNTEQQLNTGPIEDSPSKRLESPFKQGKEPHLVPPSPVRNFKSGGSPRPYVPEPIEELPN
jgi:hypothetical protein